MEFKVLSENEIKYFRTDKTHIVISIKSPGTQNAYLPHINSRIGTLWMTFNDLDTNTLALKGIKLFDEHDAVEILTFVEGLKGLVKLIVCQCEAGRSRSVGIAGALSKIYNGDDSYFFKHYTPNMLVYRTILETYYNAYPNNR